jgi:transposase
VNTVGLDLHRRRSHFAVIDEHGELLVSRGVANDRSTFLELLGDLDGEARIAIEATYGWEWAAELFEDAGYEFHLAHPKGTKAIAAARVKNDAVDAQTLAQLLRAGLLPEAYAPPREMRDLRDLLRHRIALTQLRTALKNRVHAQLARLGIQHGQSDLFGRAGRAWLADVELRGSIRRRVDSSLALIDDFDREIAATAREIEAAAKEDERVAVLCQIPGVGEYTAMLVIAEIGEIERFPTARHLCSWAGLTPTVRSSDRTVRMGHISHQGSVALRWALGQAAQTAARPRGPLREDFERIAKRRGRPIAKVAVARKILTLCFYGLRDGEIRCLAPRARSRAKPTAGAQTHSAANGNARASSRAVMTSSKAKL